MDTGLTKTDLSEFTGQPESHYGTFVFEALSQAEDLFVLATALSELPTDAMLLRVSRRGILEMAESIHEGQQYRSLRFAPFRSQNIGSYSYQLAERAVMQGIPTGIAWFDMAVRLLSAVPEFSATSVAVFDRPGDMVEIDSVRYLLGPADIHREVPDWGAGVDPSEGYDWPGVP